MTHEQMEDDDSDIELEEMVEQQSRDLGVFYKQLIENQVIILGESARNGDYPASWVEALSEAISRGRANTPAAEKIRRNIRLAFQEVFYEQDRRKQNQSKDTFTMSNTFFEDAPLLRFEVHYYDNRGQPKEALLKSIDEGHLEDVPYLFNALYIKLVVVPAQQKRKIASLTRAGNRAKKQKV